VFLWDRGRRGRVFGVLIWFGFVLFPLADAITSGGTTADRLLVIAGAAAFVASYVSLVYSWRRRPTRSPSLTMLAVMIGVSIALTVANSSHWGYLFIYCAGVVALSSYGFGWLGVMACAALAAGCALLGGGSSAAALNFAVATLGIGILMVLMRDLRVRNDELNEARAELAKTAVARERERFARDLHDLLGHSLSVIALKAELAGRLLPERPEQAATEVGDVEQVARQALGEVRRAVGGYGQPELDGELAGARMALSAAGIELTVDAPKVALEPEVEAVLAWAVREGATNVIRHSGARHCTLRVTASLADAGVEVIDDGAGDAALSNSDVRGAHGDAAPDPVAGANGSAPHALAGNRLAGHGLAGLEERARLLNGSVQAGALAGGGYRLAVTVPVSHT
jgi:two-component system sensor histidine kinase DesK